MENTAYNRQILKQINDINDRYLHHLKSTGKEVQVDNMIPLTGHQTGYGDQTGAGWFDDFKTGFTMPFKLLGLGESEKKKRGRPSKKAGSVGVDAQSMQTNELTGNGVEAAGFFDDYKVAKRKKRGTSKKKGGIIKTAGQRPNYGMISEPIVSGNPKTAGQLHARAIGSGKSEMEGAGFFDTLKSLVPLAAMALGKPEKKKRGRPSKKKAGAISGGAEKAHEMAGAGWFDDVVSGIGSVVKTAADVVPAGLEIAKQLKGRGKKAGAVSGGKKNTSPWISHVKAFAKKTGLKYKDAFAHPECKASYRKMK